jgi:hypothetical protein
MTTALADPPCRKPPEGLAAWAWVAPLALALAFVIFAHGCHGGDHDNELSAVRTEAPRPSEGSP